MTSHNGDRGYSPFMYPAIVLMTVFMLIKSAYPLLMYLLYFLASPDLTILNGIFRFLSDDLKTIVHIYTIALGTLFLWNYPRKTDT